jgi:hypothetical protein
MGTLLDGIALSLFYRDQWKRANGRLFMPSPFIVMTRFMRVIHVLLWPVVSKKDVDGPDKPGHDEEDGNEGI